MKLEIECYHGDFSITVEWPETDSDGLLDRVDIDMDCTDEGLKRLLLHHQATRSKRGRGHGEFAYRPLGQKKFEEDTRIEMSGHTANIIYIP